jgi:uncharacterized protein DUF4328
MSDDFNPYASPQAIEPSPPQVFGRGIIPFESGHKRAVWAMALFGMVIVAEVAFAINCAMQYELLSAVKRGDKFLPAIWEANDLRYRFTWGISVLARIPTIIVYLMWIHRAYRNLPALGANRLQHTPGWAVGWFFVPIACLVKPYQVAAEIWRNSDPQAIGAPRASSVAPVAFWWAAWLATIVAVRIASVVYDLAPERRTVSALMDATMAFLAISVITIIAALLAILVIHSIDKNQDARFAKISGQASTTDGY